MKLLAKLINNLFGSKSEEGSVTANTEYDAQVTKFMESVRDTFEACIQNTRYLGSVVEKHINRTGHVVPKSPAGIVVIGRDESVVEVSFKIKVGVVLWDSEISFQYDQVSRKITDIKDVDVYTPGLGMKTILDYLGLEYSDAAKDKLLSDEKVKMMVVKSFTMKLMTEQITLREVN